MRLPVPPLLVISDRRQARRPLEELAEAAFAGGCRWFSLREKDLPPAERRALLGALVVLVPYVLIQGCAYSGTQAGTALGQSVKDYAVLPSSSSNTVNDFATSGTDLAQRLSKLSDEINDIVKNVKEGKGTVGRLFNDESLYNNLNATIRDRLLLLRDTLGGLDLRHWFSSSEARNIGGKLRGVKALRYLSTCNSSRSSCSPRCCCSRW